MFCLLECIGEKEVGFSFFLCLCWIMINVVVVVVMFIISIRGIFVEMILLIGMFVVFVVSFGVVWMIKFLDRVKLCLNKFMVMVVVIGGKLVWVVVGSRMVLIKVISGEG